MDKKTKYAVPRGASANKAKAKYNSKTYDVFQIIVPKGQKDIISQIAAHMGYKSRNEFIVAAINEKIAYGGVSLPIKEL